MGANKILYGYILDKYGDVVNFSNISDINLIDLNAVLLKDNVPKEICMGLRLCDILDLDIAKMIFEGQIREITKITDANHKKSAGIPEKPEKFYKSNKTVKTEKSGKTAAGLEIYNKCMRLSEIEKKKILEYIDNILDEKNENI